MITRRGYQLNINNISNEYLIKIKKDLFVIPKTNTDYNSVIVGYNMLHRTKKNFFLPRYYGIKHFGGIIDHSIFDSTKIDINFSLSLRQNQLDIVNEILPKIIKNGGGIITLPCGFGKTIIALYLVSVLKLKTLILVHKTFLQDQWINKIKEFIPDATIGIIKQNIIEHENKDFIVGMIQSISQKNYDSIIFNDIGLIIVDECHHIASKVFSKCLYKVGANYTIGLSATPTRKDGLTKVIKWYLGKQLCNVTEHINKKTVAIQFNYSINEQCNEFILFKEAFRYVKTRYVPNTIKMITNLTNLNIRNDFITNIIALLAKNSLRKILILSSRIKHLEILKKNTDVILKKLNIDTQTNLYIGKSTKEERIDAENNASIIFASFSMAHEGLDIPKLNTILLTTPQKDVIQSIGRIMRKTNNSCYTNPLIIDIVDKLSVFNNYGNLKLKLYNKNNYNIFNFNICNNQIINNSSDNLVIDNILDENFLKTDNSIFNIKYTNLNNDKNNDKNNQIIKSCCFLDEIV